MHQCERVAYQLILLMMLSVPTFGQRDKDVIVLEHADSLVGMEINGERARELIGHVRFRQGTTMVNCERATQYLTSNKVSFDGVVEVHDDTLRMVGQRGMYYGDTKVAEAFDRVMLEDRTTVLRAAYGKYFIKEKKAYFKTNVFVEDTTSELTADELTYFREEEKSIAIGHVKVVNAKNNITILGNHFENFKKEKYSKVTEQPKVIQIDTSGGKSDTLLVTSVIMESYQDSLERLVATDSVKIIRSGLAAEAGVSIYLTNRDSIVLNRSPIVWYTTEKLEDNQVSGDSIAIKLKKRKLETVYVRGRAFAISNTDTAYPKRFNQMSGREIILHFANDKIQQIRVNTTATSLYYLFEKRKGNGMNKTTGDRVVMSFVDGKMDKINVIAGVEGQYFPEKLVKGRESEYNLQGFNWRENRPGREQQQVESKK